MKKAKQRSRSAATEFEFNLIVEEKERDRGRKYEMARLEFDCAIYKPYNGTILVYMHSKLCGEQCNLWSTLAALGRVQYRFSCQQIK